MRIIECEVCWNWYFFQDLQVLPGLSKIGNMESCPSPAVYVCMSCSGYPPWILKRGGLESSGRILISSNGKTKKIMDSSECPLCDIAKLECLLSALREQSLGAGQGSQLQKRGTSCSEGLCWLVCLLTYLVCTLSDLNRHLCHEYDLEDAVSFMPIQISCKSESSN